MPRPAAVDWMENPGNNAPGEEESLVTREATRVLIDIGDATGFSIDAATSDKTLVNLAEQLRNFAKTEGDEKEANMPTRAALVKYLQGLRHEVGVNPAFNAAVFAAQTARLEAENARLAAGGKPRITLCLTADRATPTDYYYQVRIGGVTLVRFDLTATDADLAQVAASAEARGWFQNDWAPNETLTAHLIRVRPELATVDTQFAADPINRFL